MSLLFVNQSLTLSFLSQFCLTLGLRLFGLDVIAPTVAEDLEASGGHVIEINTPPGHFYHDLRKDAGRPIALQLLERMLGDDS